MIPRSKLSHASMAKLLLSVACSVRPGSSSMVNRFGATIVSTWLTDGFLPVPGRSRRARACPLMGWPGRVQRLFCWTTVGGRYAKLKEHAMRTSQQSLDTVSTIGIESCQRLMSIPGVGPIVSSAVVAAIGNGTGFKQGRDFAAWLGLIPKRESTGDRTILGKISKRGNKYVRTLFVQAAHVVLERRPRTARQGLWPWIEQASKRLHRNMLAIALAN